MRDETDYKSVAGCLFVILSIFMVIPLITIFRGFVLQKLWLWFMIPFGLSEIGLAHALGLSVLIGLFTGSGSTKKDKNSDGPDYEGLANSIGTSLLTSTLVLLMGWIFHCFM